MVECSQKTNHFALYSRGTEAGPSDDAGFTDQSLRLQPRVSERCSVRSHCPALRPQQARLSPSPWAGCTALRVYSDRLTAILATPAQALLCGQRQLLGVLLPGPWLWNRILITSCFPRVRYSFFLAYIHPDWPLPPSMLSVGRWDVLFPTCASKEKLREI